MNPITFSKVLAAALLAAAIPLAGCAGIPRASGTAHVEEQFAKVQRGMTKDDVVRLLGEPRETMPFRATRTESFDYIGWDTWGYMVRFSVVFDESGRVASTVAARLNDGGNKGG